MACAYQEFQGCALEPEGTCRDTFAPSAGSMQRPGKYLVIIRLWLLNSRRRQDYRRTTWLDGVLTDVPLVKASAERLRSSAGTRKRPMGSSASASARAVKEAGLKRIAPVSLGLESIPRVNYCLGSVHSHILAVKVFAERTKRMRTATVSASNGPAPSFGLKGM